MGGRAYLKILRTCILLLLAGFMAMQATAQVHAPVQDSTQKEHIGTLRPSSIVAKYTYDPITNRYIYTEKIDDISLSYPLVLTPKEFRERVRKERMKAYFKQKFNAVSGRGTKVKEDQKNLLPIFYVNNNFFKSIFGGNKIEIIPRGSVEVGLGVLFNKRDNPSLSPRNRNSFAFDFDQIISLSMRGHIGKRLTINANFDTQSTFNFQNRIKLEYTPNEDDIVQKIEVGNVSMPLSNSLIQGSQSLFGVKTKLKFGKTTITGVYAQQNSELQRTLIRGGGAVQQFKMFALDYDENRHFFLAHYFKQHYNEALKNYPYINSNVRITRVEVWVTNRSNSPRYLKNARNIVAIQDLGEANPAYMGVFLDAEGNPVTPPAYAGFLNAQPGAYPDNGNNDFNPMGIEGPQQSSLTPAIRNIATVGQGFGALSSTVDEGVDYAKLENARQLEPGEYTLHPKLGYISLKTRIRNDEMLAVAFQYVVNGQVYQVGEFSSGGIDASQPTANPQAPNGPQIANTQSLVVKLLKSPITNVKEPVWGLMMKNIYALDAFQLQQEGFEFNILYTDPQPLNYIAPVESTTLPNDVSNTALLQVFNMDNLNVNQDPVVGGDGFFDYVPGITIDPQNGLLIFTTVQPFGKYLFQQLQATNGTANYDAPSTYNPNQKKYVFRAMYTGTKIQAQQEQAAKNKFQLVGEFKSSRAGGIPIGAFNVPRGSVTVTAGGRELQEGVDYIVNYELGRVKIINEALKASDVPINVTTENNALFGQRTKRFMGLHIQHKFNDHFLMGATYLNLNEKPQTYKSNYGFLPINNSMYGFNFSYSTAVPFLTRLVNKLPNIDTDVESHLSIRGEFAYLHPGVSRGSRSNGEVTSYVDDFEASQTAISILSPHAWYLSSVPIGFGGEKSNGDISSGFQRAKLNWYTIDPIFYSNRRPSGITDNDLSQYSTRRILKSEIFPETDIMEGDTRAIYSLDLSYYPKERGMYNYNPAAAGTNTLPQPKDNFGGIMRGIRTSNFEQTNVQYIQFWVMDPYVYNENANLSQGMLVFNLGSISEDVLMDGRKQYENGLPRDGSIGRTLETNFGRVPTTQSLVYAFDTEGQARAHQDIGFDGLDNLQEAHKYPAFSNLQDPANDDYEYYLSREGGVSERYRLYNGVQGNSPSAVGQKNRGNSTLPTVEDVNRDNTMNTINSYFEYKIPIFPGMSVSNNTSTVAGIERDYITDVREVTVKLQNGQQMRTRWVQFKIPLSTDSKFAVGGISDMRSIRFMRLFLTDFNEHVVLRFGAMKLVRGDYRKYTQAFEPNGTAPGNTPNTIFTSASVSTEKTTNYVSPPGVYREKMISNNQTIREDEQSLALTIKNLAPNDMRAVYKNFRVDMRQYKNLKMYLHAASLPSPSPQLMDGQLSAFIRIGSDFESNFYQIEIPLKVTQGNPRDPYLMWPEENKLDLALSLLQKIKATVIGNSTQYNANQLYFFDKEGNPISGNTNTGELQVGIKGNPSFGDIRVIMLGVKNTGKTDVSGVVWFNELRLTDMKNNGGWAAHVNMDVNFADLMAISANARRKTVGFGAIDMGPNMRSREDVKGYDFVTHLNAGHLFPDKWGLRIPVSYSRGEELITPQYDPVYRDLELETLLANTDNPERRDELKRRAQNYTMHQSISVIGLHKQRTSDRKPLPIDLANFTFSAVYNQVNHRDFRIEESLSQNINVGATYDYNFDPVKVEPFKNVAFLDSSRYFQPLRDFNFYLLPTSITATGNILRQYNMQKYRQINLPPGALGMPKLYQRDYRFNWGFTVNYKLTESLNFVFSETNNRIVRNYLNANNVQDNTVGIWDNFFDVGLPNQHNQNLQVNYELPFDKFPFLQFINAQYSYTGNFQWQRGSAVLNSLPNIPDLGNTVQNSRTHQFNATLSMQRLYDYIGLKKKEERQDNTQNRRNRLGFTHTENTEASSENSGELSFGDRLLNTGIDILTAVNRITIDYQNTRGTFLPGYLQNVGFIGTLNPTLGFTFGGQSDIRQLAAENGWLTLYQQFNQQYMSNQIKTLSLRADIDLLPDLTIDLNAERTYAHNYAENYQVDPVTKQYQSLAPHSYGNFSISTVMLGTAFNSSNEVGSATFEQFRHNRLVIANRLARRAGIDLTNPSNINPQTGFPKGFGRTSQQVLLPAFLAAYRGTDAATVSLSPFRDTPLPNWNLKYTGLMRLDFFQERFKRFSIRHGYSSGYTINQFQSNLLYDYAHPYSMGNRDQNGDFRSKTLIANVNLVEQFSPLIRLDMEMRNSVSVMAEVDKDRALSLSFANNLLTEINGVEYKLGLGYRIKDLKVTTSIGGHQRVLSSDLNLKASVSYRKNKTIVRYLDINDSQVTTGQSLWEIHFTADYALSNHLTAIFYYDHNFSEYYVSTAFPQTTIRSGIKLRYTFGN